MTATNNGNVHTQSITVPGLAQPFIQTYIYDDLNRLKSATETNNSTQTWKQTFVFDRYGNRRFDFTGGNTTVPASSCTEAICNPTISTSDNRLTSTGYTYDNAGNTTADAQGRTFVYDAENKQTSVSDTGGTIGTYSYDGDGKRVKKVSANETVVFVYNAMGQLVAEYADAISQTPKVNYLTADHLGSPRINTDANGAVTARHDYHPFGEEIATSQRTSGLGYTADTVRKQFTGYERDGETDLDFAQARMFSSNLGRFRSADDFVKDSRVSEPQSWNKYVYARNNPLKLIDPEGEKATVSIATDEENKIVRIKVKASIAFYGEGKLDEERRNKAAHEAAKRVADGWSGTYEKNGFTYVIETTIDYAIVSSKEDGVEQGFQNVIGLVDGEVGYGRDSEAGTGGIGSVPDFGRWNVNTVGEVAAHEFGHLLGVGNRSSGKEMMNKNLLSDPSVSRRATVQDFEWAFGGSVNSHREKSRPTIPNPETRGTGSANRSLGSPRSRTSTSELRASRIPFWWN